MSENTIKSQLEEASKFVNSGKYREAMDLYEDLITRDDQCAEAWLMLGSLYGEDGDTDKAVEYIKRAVTIEPGNSSALEMLGQIYSSMGDSDAALNYFNRAVTAHPEDSQLLCLLGEAHRVNGSIKDAINSYEQALACKDPSDQIMAMLGYLYLQDGDNLKAEENYRQAISIDGGDAASVTGWCVAMADMERPAAADQMLEEYIQKDIVDPEINSQLASLCSSIGRHGDAMELIQHVIEKAPSDDKYLLMKADILERQGDLPGTFEILKPYLESQPVDVRAVLVFAKFSHIVGLKDECMQLLQGVLSEQDMQHETRDQVLKAINWVNDNEVSGSSA